MLRSLLGLALVGAAGAQGSVAELTAPFGDGGDLFGISVAMGPRHLVVGAPGTGPQYRGRAYLFDRATGGHLKTYAPTDWAPQDNLGHAVAIDDEVCVLACLSDDGAVNAGSVYVYDLDTGQLRFELHSPMPAAADSFGTAVALGPGYIAVSSPGDDGAAVNAGAIFLFQRETGALLRTFRAKVPREGMRLGQALAVDHNFVVTSAFWDQGGEDNVGAVFVFDMLLGVQRHKLLAWDRAAYDRFGTAIDVQDGRALIGSPYRDEPGAENIGKAYLYDLVTGELIRDIEAPPIEEEGAYFGFAVAIADGALIVGAPGSDLVAEDAGQVHVFDADGDHLDHFGDPWAKDRFGEQLAALGSRALIGVPKADPFGASSGEAHLVCLERGLGLPYCGPANLNSTGVPAAATIHGAQDLGCDRFDVHASQLPPGALCGALVARHEGFVPLAWGGNGNLCLAEPIAVFRAEVTTAQLDGTATLALDLREPLPAPIAEPILTGETWRFQVWYRDHHGGPTSNFTDGVAVTFE